MSPRALWFVGLCVIVFLSYFSIDQARKKFNHRQKKRQFNELRTGTSGELKRRLRQMEKAR